MVRCWCEGVAINFPPLLFIFILFWWRRWRRFLKQDTSLFLSAALSILRCFAWGRISTHTPRARRSLYHSQICTRNLFLFFVLVWLIIFVFVTCCCCCFVVSFFLSLSSDSNKIYSCSDIHVAYIDTFLGCIYRYTPLYRNACLHLYISILQ